MKKILFADNDTRFLKARTELLKGASYEVLTASSLQEAECALNEAYIHVAVLDLRLVDDHDERDLSGLRLAKNPAYRRIPKIILTRYPTYDAVREALGVALHGLPPAVGFVAKQEGSEALIRAVESAFTLHVQINWELLIESNERNPITFPYLTTLIEPSLEGERLMDRA